MSIFEKIEQLLSEFTMKYDSENISNYVMYIRMAQEKYEEYKYYQQKYYTLIKNNLSWNPVEHSIDEFRQYIDLGRSRQDYAIETIVFEAFAAEAYINYYGEKNLGTEKYFKEYEKNHKKRSTLVKYREIAGIPEDSDVYKKLKSLMDARNDLAHNHVRKFDINDSNDDNALFTLFNVGIKGDKSIYVLVDYVIGTTKELQDVIIQSNNTCCRLA